MNYLTNPSCIKRGLQNLLRLVLGSIFWCQENSLDWQAFPLHGTSFLHWIQEKWISRNKKLTKEACSQVATKTCSAGNTRTHALRNPELLENVREQPSCKLQKVPQWQTLQNKLSVCTSNKLLDFGHSLVLQTEQTRFWSAHFQANCTISFIKARR